MTEPTDLQRVEWAIGFLRNARDQLKMAGAHRAADKVRRALKSAEGAERHARLAPYREARHDRTERLAALGAAEEQLRSEQTPTFDDDGKERVQMATCGVCGGRWNDAAVSGCTPVPSARCPFEDMHTYDDDEDPPYFGPELHPDPDDQP